MSTSNFLINIIFLFIFNFSYYEALDNSLLKYHSKRMEEINKLINYYWTMTYKGQDIKFIEIRSDIERTVRSRSYNYRIVFGTAE